MDPDCEIKERRPGKGPRRQTVALAVCVVTVLGGCLSRPSLVPQSFSFIAPSHAAGQERRQTGRQLEIRRVVIAAPFDSQSLTYRTGEYSFERDPYAQFLVPPAESLGAALQSYFQDATSLGIVAQPGSLLHADTLVEVYVDKLYGGFPETARTAGGPKHSLCLLSASARCHPKQRLGPGVHARDTPERPDAGGCRRRVERRSAPDRVRGAC